MSHRTSLGARLLNLLLALILAGMPAVTSARPSVEYPAASNPDPQPSGAIITPSATMVDSLQTDRDSDGSADPGDTLRYTTTISNPLGITASGVVLSVPLDPNTSLVPGSVRISALAFPESYSVVVGTPLVVAAPGLLANDTGTPAPSALAVTVATLQGGSATISADGSFTYTPPSRFSGSDSFSYTATNSAGSDTGTVSLTVQLAPVAGDDSYTAVTDTPLVVAAPGLLANDTGAPAPAATAGVVATLQGGSVTIGADGSFTYTSPAGFSGSDSFDYTITNAAGSDTGTVTLTVGTAPIASDDLTYTTPIDTPLSVVAGAGPPPDLLINDSLGSPKATLVSFGGGSLPGSAATNAAGSSVSFGTGGSLLVNADGTFSFTPSAGFTGLFTFEYRVSNIFGTSDGLAQIAVQEAPTITSANSATFVVGQAGSFTVTTSGFPTPALTRGGVALPSGVTFTDNGDGTGTLAGTPAAATGGTYAISFTAANGVGADDTQNFTLTVNQAPAITSANSATFTVGAAGSFTVTTTGFPTPSLTRGGVALPSGVTFTDNGDGTGTLAGTPAAATGGTYAISFTAANGIGTNATESFTLTVNEAPAITSANSATFVVGQAGSFTVTTTGFPTPSLTRGGVALPSGVTFTDNGDGTGTLAGTPAAATGGTYAISFTAANGVGADDTQSFTLTVNQAPAITSASTITFPVGVAGSFTVTTSGFPTPALTRGGVALPSGVTFTDNGDGTGTLAGTPAAGTAASYAISFTAANGVGTDANQNFTLVISEAPTITSANSATFVVGQAGSFTVTTSGFPTPALTRGGVALPSGVTFTDNGDGTGTLAGTPAAATGGTYAITFQASSTSGTSALQSFTLTVNQAPAITSANSATFVVGQAGSFTVATTGFPTPSLTRGGVALPSGVTFTDNGDGTGTLAGTPAATTGGTYAISFTAANGVGTDATQSFTLTVNEAPAITSANSATFVVGQAGSFTVTTTGFPAPAITRGGVALPSGVTFTDNGDGTGTLAGTPAAGTAANYAITFQANNIAGTTPAQSFTLTVGQPPAITSANSATFVVGQAGSFTVTTTGFPTPSLTRGGVALPSGVTFTDNGDGTGTLAGTPAAATGGTYAISFTAANGIGTNATQSFTLTVNEAPAITSANSTTFTVGTAGSFTVTTTGFPGVGIGSSGALPIGVTFTDNLDGTATLAGTPGLNSAGTYPLVITASNGVNPNATQNFTLSVVCPVITVSPAAGALTGGTYNIAYSQIFSATGGNGGYTFDLSAGAIPAGLTLATGGDLTGAPSTTGDFSFTVRATDSLGCVGTQSYTLAVRPDAQDESFSGGVGNTQYVVGATQPSTPHIFVSGSVLSNDDGPATISAGPASITSANSGSVTMGADGSFTYTPAVGFSGPSDSFDYTLTDGNGQTAVATVTINLSGVVWYVNSSGANGDGRSSSPFNALNNADAPSAAGSTIFVHTGSGATPGSLTLDSGQTLWGQGTAFSLGSLTIPAGAKPTLSGAVTLAQNSTISSLDISVTGATVAVTGSGSITGVTVTNNVAVTSVAGTAVSLNGVGGTITFRSVSSNGAASGISLTNTTGSFTITGDAGGANNGSGGTIQLSSGPGVLLNNAQAVSLGYLNIQGGLDDGIRGTSVAGLTLSRSNVTSNGNASGESGLDLSLLSGVVSLTNNTLSGSADRNLLVSNASGVISSLTITGNTISGAGQDGVFIQLPPGSTGTVTSISASANTITGNGSSGFRVSAEGTGVVSAVSFTGNTATSNNNGITLDTNAVGDILGAVVTNNTLSGAATQISVANNGDAGSQIVATFDTNTVTATAPFAIAVWLVSDGSGSIVTRLNANSVTQHDETGIELQSRGGAANVQATLTNNSVVGAGSNAFADYYLVNGNGTLGENSTFCGNITGNTAPGLLQLDQIAANGIGIQSLTPPSGATEPQVSAFLAGTNPGIGSVDALGSTYTAATCTTPLTSAAGEGPGAPESATLEQADLAPIAAAAIARWQSSGISAEQSATLESATLEVADLGAGQLGSASGGLIQIDRDAAGWGWFIDPTPADDAEYLSVGETELLAEPGSLADGRMDLITAVAHEMGHLIGYADLTAEEGAQQLMVAEVATGVRRTPGIIPGRAAAAPAQALTTVTASIGALPSGKRVVVIFDVLIDDPLGVSVTRVTNQGTVSSASFSSFQTDDPAAPGASDPTVTIVARFSAALPLVISSSYPDLVIDRITYGPTVQVVIRNQGENAVVTPFWVDLYINPRIAPTRVNQTYQLVGTYGMTWGVTSSIPAGGTLTLTQGGAFYRSDLSTLPPSVAAGTPIYAQVDSANALTSYGGVLEKHEAEGGVYNNISGPVAAGSATLSAAPLGAQRATPGMPPRPAPSGE